MSMPRFDHKAEAATKAYYEVDVKAYIEALKKSSYEQVKKDYEETMKMNEGIKDEEVDELLEFAEQLKKERDAEEMNEFKKIAEQALKQANEVDARLQKIEENINVKEGKKPPQYSQSKNTVWNEKQTNTQKQPEKKVNGETVTQETTVALKKKKYGIL